MWQIYLVHLKQRGVTVKVRHVLVLDLANYILNTLRARREEQMMKKFSVLVVGEKNNRSSVANPRCQVGTKEMHYSTLSINLAVFMITSTHSRHQQCLFVEYRGIINSCYGFSSQAIQRRNLLHFYKGHQQQVCWTCGQVVKCLSR